MKVATVCYIKKDGKTLMLHRIKKEKDINKDKWIGVGGRIELGETPEECVIREVYEETGLKIKNPILKGIFTAPKTEIEHDDDWYGFIFVVHDFEGKLIEDCNEGELCWVDDNKIFDLPMWEGDKKFLHWLDKPQFFSFKMIHDSQGRLIESEEYFY